MLEFDQSFLPILECCEKEGITLADILAFSVFVSTLRSMPAHVTVQLLKCLFWISEKKEKAILGGCEKTKHWALERLANRYYKKPMQPDKLVPARMGANTVADVVKYTVTDFYLRQMKKRDMYIFHEKTMADKTPDQLFYIYSVLYTAAHDAKISRYYAAESIADPRTLQLFTNCITRLGKTELVRAKLESVVLKNGCYLLGQHATDKNKMIAVIGEGGIKTAYLKYLQDVEEAALGAIDEVSASESKMLTERREYGRQILVVQQELSECKKMNEELLKEVDRLRIENELLKKGRLLQNQTVLVVGDTAHKNGYKEIVEGYGGVFLFVDGAEEPQRTALEAKKADIIVHITAYGKHTSHDNLKRFDNVFHVNHAGLNAFKQTLENQVAAAML